MQNFKGADSDVVCAASNLEAMNKLNRHSVVNSTDNSANDRANHLVNDAAKQSDDCILPRCLQICVCNYYFVEYSACC
jgi:hypothetical protein